MPGRLLLALAAVLCLTACTTEVGGTATTTPVITHAKRVDFTTSCQDLLPGERIADLVGGKLVFASSPKNLVLCVWDFEDEQRKQFTVQVALIEFAGGTDQLPVVDVGGNNAHQVASDDRCSLVVMLNNGSPTDFGSRLTVVVTNAENPCRIATTLATAGFAALPDA